MQETEKKSRFKGLRLFKGLRARGRPKATNDERAQLRSDSQSSIPEAPTFPEPRLSPSTEEINAGCLADDSQFPRSTVQTNLAENKVSASRALDNLKNAIRAYSKAPDSNSGDMANPSTEPSKRIIFSALNRMNKSLGLLSQVISVIDNRINIDSPQTSTIESLDQGVEELNKMIGKLIVERNESADATGALRSLGCALEKIYKHITPFLKVVLTVGVQGSAVLPIPIVFLIYF
jgi:hypothetical protein